MVGQIYSVSNPHVNGPGVMWGLGWGFDARKTIPCRGLVRDVSIELQLSPPSNKKKKNWEQLYGQGTTPGYRNLSMKQQTI